MSTPVYPRTRRTCPSTAPNSCLYFCMPMLRSHFWTSCRVHCSGLCHEHRAGHPPREPAALCPCCGRDLQVDCPERHRMRCLRQRDGHQGVEQHLGEGSRLRRRWLRLEAAHRPCSHRCDKISTRGACRVASKRPSELLCEPRPRSQFPSEVPAGSPHSRQRRSERLQEHTSGSHASDAQQSL